MKPIAGILLLAALAASPLPAGVVYEIDVTDHETSPPSVESTAMAAEGRSLKMGIVSGEGSRQGDMIYRADRREMVVVDHEDKSYMVMDEEAIKQLAAQVGQAMSQVDKALENVPEEQRAMVEQMMKGRMPQAAQKPPPLEARKTGDRGEKNGYPCVRYELWRGDRKISELWVTDWDNVEGGDQVVDLFREMAEFFRGMMEAMREASGMEGVGADMEESIFESLDKVDGFPVMTRDFGGDGALEGETSLRSARRRTLDPAEFEPPAGYKRRSMFGE